MNVSMNHMAYDVIEMYRATYKDTDSLDIRQAYHWVNTARAFLVKQRLDKNIFDIYEEEIQKIEYLPLEETLGSYTAGTGGIVQTTVTVPATINRKGYHGTLTRVSYPYTSDATTTSPPANEEVFAGSSVQIVPPTRFKRVGNRKFNSNFFYATIGSGKKLYFKNYLLGSASPDLDYVTAEGVFQNPIEVMELNSVADPYNADYPINSNLIKDIINLIVSDKFRLILQQVEDKKGEDGRDTTTQ